MRRVRSALCRFTDAGNRIEAARITDIGQALGDHTHQEVLVISKVHVALGMRDELRLTAALRSQEAKGDHLALLEIQTAAGIIVACPLQKSPPEQLPLFPGGSP